MESKFQYRLTEKAAADLDEIVSYIAVKLSNRQAASDFVDKLQKSIDAICALPQSGTPVDNDFLADIHLRKKLIGNYTMYYLAKPTEKIIYIVRIVYAKRNMDEILRQINL